MCFLVLDDLETLRLIARQFVAVVHFAFQVLEYGSVFRLGVVFKFEG
jgi:hypothetical protein